MLRTVSLATLATGLVIAPLAAQEDTVITVEAAVARSVVDRMPVDTASTFPVDVGEVALWTRVSGAAGTTIQHVWIYGEYEFPVSLEIGGSPWRTYSTKAIPPEWAGEWRVEIRDADSSVIKTVRFAVGR
jgi:Protein of unknown function (DUF2914)